MSLIATKSESIPAIDISDVSQLARRFGRVLLSRRLLRAVATTVVGGVLIILMVAIVVPSFIVLTHSVSDWRGYARLGLGVLLLLSFAAGFLIVGAILMRTLSVLARGDRRTSIALIAITAVWLQSVARSDVTMAVSPSDVFPLHAVAYLALFIHLVIAFALIVGPYELIRATDFERSVFAEHRFRTGFLVDLGRLLDFPDPRALNRRGWGQAWSFLALSLLLEWLAFGGILDLGTNLVDQPKGKLPEIEISESVLVPMLLSYQVVMLFFSFGILRLTLIAARWLRASARRATLQSAAEVVATDSRPPVLFLRSFEKEQVPLTGARLPWLLRAFDPGAEYRTLEEMIVFSLTYVGPVVAVADPSQLDTSVGASRWHLGDDEWQPFVEAQIERAGLIVVGVAETSGLWWEIEALKRSPGALARTIFVCPPGATCNRSLLSKLTRVIDASLDDPNCSAFPDSCEHVLAAALLPDGTPTLFVASGVSEAAYRVAFRVWIEKLHQSPRITNAILKE